MEGITPSPMDNRFENISLIRDVMRDSENGLWCMEIDEGVRPRLYPDDTFRAIMGMAGSLSPEECFCFWSERIPYEDMDKVNDTMDRIIQGRFAEVFYAWNHPAKGKIYIRCGGKRDLSYTKGIRCWGNHQDVTELARTRMDIEQKLKQSEKKNRSLIQSDEKKDAILNSFPGGIAVICCTQDGVWVPEFLSEGFATMSGMSMERVWDLYRGDAMTGVHPDDRQQLSSELDRYFSGDKECVELVYRLKKGISDYIWVRNTLTTLKDENGTKKVYCVYQDMTQERKEREQLRRQYDEHIAHHFRVVGPNLLVAGYSNITQDRMLEIVDNTKSALLNRYGDGRDSFFIGMAGLIAEEADRQSFFKTFLNRPALDAFAKGCTELVQVCFACFPADLHGRYVQFKLCPITDPDTRDVMGILTVADVTEQTVTRKILRKLSILGCDLVMDVDLCEDSLTLLSVDGPASFPIKKDCFSQFIERAARQHVIPRDRRLVKEMLSSETILKKLKDADSYSVMYGIMDIGGETRVKKLTVSAVDLRIGRVCLARMDVTDALETERRNQSALEHALAQAEQANRAKSDFLSSMSHDIRTPLNAIMGMTALAQAHMDDRDRLENCLQKIALSSSHLLSLVNDILDMNRIERHKLVLNREMLYLPEILEQIYAMFSIQAQQKNLSFEVLHENLSERFFFGDPLRLNQILINLLGNAIKFTPAGGCIALEAEELLSGDAPDRVRYRFTVRDTGMGMSKDDLEHLFDPFFRGKAAAHVEGSGLGLSIVKGLVDLMGGSIAAESREGHGSTFFVELEFDAAEDPGNAIQESGYSATGESLPLSGFHILAAEDNALNAEILCDLLEMKGARLDIRENGALAVETFRSAEPGTYNVILMDIQMPVMDGHEASRTIRTLDRPDAKTIPIIAMTANAFAEDVRAALDAGMNAHVSKPIDIERVVRLLKQYSGVSEDNRA